MLIPAYYMGTVRNLLCIAFNRGMFLVSTDKYVSVGHDSVCTIKMAHYNSNVMLCYSKFGLGELRTYISSIEIARLNISILQNTLEAIKKMKF